MKFLSLLVCLLLSVSFFISSCQKTADHTAEILEGINGIKFKNDSLLNVTIHLQKSLDSIKNQINQNTSILNSINTKITGLQVSIDTLISNIKVLNTKIDTANSNINGLQVQMNNLSKQYLSLSSQISSVFATISVKIDSLNLQIGINNASINKLQTEYLVTQIKVDSILLAIQLNNQLLTSSNNNIASIQAQLILLTNEYNTVITLLNQLIGLINGQSTLATSINSGLIAWYPFSGNAIDSSGNGNNGSYVNNVQFGTDRNGIPNAAFSDAGGFNNGRIITNSNFFNFLFTNSFTISFWVLDAGSSGGRIVSTENPEGNFRIASYGSGIYAYAFGSSESYVYDTLTLNQWTYVTFTYDNRNVKQYKNGVLKFSGTNISTAPFTYGTPFTIGAKAASAYDNWFGKIDELRIYNRAITAQEANYLYTH